MSASRSGSFRKVVASVAGIAVVALTAAVSAGSSTVISGTPQLAVTHTPAAASQEAPASTPAAGEVARFVAGMQPAVKVGAVSPDEARALPAAVVPVAAMKAAPSVVTKYCSGTSLQVVDGPGYRVDTGPALSKFRSVHIGAYVDCRRGKLIYCIQSLKILTKSQKLKFTENLRSKGSTITQEVAYVVNHWGQTRSNPQSAAVSVALKKIVKDVPFTKDYKSTYLPELKSLSKNKNFGALVNRYISWAKAYRGSVRLTVSVTKKPSHVGQTGTAVVKLVSTKTGKAWPNHSVSIHLSGATATKSLPHRSNSHGTATIHFRAVRIGTVAITASTSYRASVRVLVTVPSTTQQTLVSPVTTASHAKAKAALSIKRPKAPKVTQHCLTRCEGTAPVKVTPSCNVKGAATKVTFITVTDRDTKKVTTYKVSLAAGKCGSKTIEVADRGKVCASDRYLLNGKYTGRVTAQTCVTVDCPPLPSVHVTITQQVGIDCPCGGSAKISVSRSKVTITASRNESHAKQVLIVNGETVAAWGPGNVPDPFVFSLSPKTELTVQSGTHLLRGGIKLQTNLSGKSLLDLLQQ